MAHLYLPGTLLRILSLVMCTVQTLFGQNFSETNTSLPPFGSPSLTDQSRHDIINRVRLSDQNHVLLALKEATNGIQRKQCGNSLGPTREYLLKRFNRGQNYMLDAAFSIMDESIDQNAVKFRRLTESLLGYGGGPKMEIIFPTWPVSYPDKTRRLLFHVTPFRPKWSDQVMEIVTRACKETTAPTTYVRGDYVLEPDIIDSIWNHLCCATHVLVDLTGLNPNVTLELGIAHTLGRKVLLISQDDPKTFPHLAKLRIHRYTLTPIDPQSLPRIVNEFLSKTL